MNPISTHFKNELNNNLTTKLPGQLKLIAEGSGASVKYYAQLGADAASKKRLGDITYLGQFVSTDTGISSFRTFSLTSIIDYKKLTADKLFIEYVSFTSYAARVSYAHTLSYDSNSGILTVRNNKGSSAYIDSCTINVYLKQ